MPGYWRATAQKHDVPSANPARALSPRKTSGMAADLRSSFASVRRYLSIASARYVIDTFHVVRYNRYIRCRVRHNRPLSKNIFVACETAHAQLHTNYYNCCNESASLAQRGECHEIPGHVDPGSHGCLHRRTDLHQRTRQRRDRRQHCSCPALLSEQAMLIATSAAGALPCGPHCNRNPFWSEPRSF